MCDLCISMPFSSGIAIIAGPGIQVGATCDQKSHRKRLAQPKQPSRAMISEAQPISKPSRAAFEAQPAQPSRPSSAGGGSGVSTSNWSGEPTYRYILKI